MERLTKTYSDGTHAAADNLPCGENSYEYKGLLLETLGKYEDAEEQGLLLRLPCKVGDTVYHVVQGRIVEWIPCSERLPEEAFGCLVTVMDCEPSTQTDFENILPYFVGYDGETWNDADGKEIPFEVIAWMPLPKPYKESDRYVKH